MPIEPILSAAAAGATLVTPNNRLARRLSGAHDDAAVRRGKDLARSAGAAVGRLARHAVARGAGRRGARHTAVPRARCGGAPVAEDPRGGISGRVGAAAGPLRAGDAGGRRLARRPRVGRGWRELARLGRRRRRARSVCPLGGALSSRSGRRRDARRSHAGRSPCRGRRCGARVARPHGGARRLRRTRAAAASTGRCAARSRHDDRGTRGAGRCVRRSARGPVGVARGGTCRGIRLGTPPRRGLARRIDRHRHPRSRGAPGSDRGVRRGSIRAARRSRGHAARRADGMSRSAARSPTSP